ncbi:putative Mg2+ transporter-C (MgtC) family protein [Bacillus sp. OV322]|uniref:MgtC/SapB family protein n=1 Tax=Bacillus sp. OV322 TaxID=1882764 RepID=UPI0008EFCF48|nr:MgtC/SapB family protein [Bacillus sp. OV322]SFC53099.1 putative Mg2+ transporter-C (MgtC) family protein [Bacillus sp. OV322]
MHTLKEVLLPYLYNDTVIKLGIAAIVGIIIGLERELKQKPAGIKTTMVLTVGSCLLTIVSIHSAALYSEAYTKPMDPLRLAAQIVSGIGFLGGGVILQRSNDVISGITTAAIVWVAGGIGISIGAGFYEEAIVALIFILIAVEVIPPVLNKIGPPRLKEKRVRVKLAVQKEQNLTDLLKELKSKNLKVRKVKVKEEKDHVALSCVVVSTNDVYTTDIYYHMKSLKGVNQAEIESY